MGSEMCIRDRDRTVMEANIFLERTIKGYRVYETRDFINAILGGALEYADDLPKIEKKAESDNEDTSKGN